MALAATLPVVTYLGDLQNMLRPFPPLIYKKTCFSTGRMKYFIETFRALGVARGHSSYKLTKSVSFYIKGEICLLPSE